MIDKLRKHGNTISISLITFSGVLCITTGFLLPTTDKKQEKSITKISVSQKMVSSQKSNEIILKEISTEVNQPISVDVKDYVVDEKLEKKVLNKLELDTSMVNISEAGTYTYTVTYKKKIFNGTYIIKEKPLPAVETMTLKSFTLAKGSPLSTNISDYVSETLSDEVKANARLNLTSVNVNNVGTYQYSIIYNGKFYTGNITIYEPQPTIKATIEPKDVTKEEETKTQ